MKINKKYITPLLIAGTMLTLIVVGEKADAAVLTGNVDTSGAVTGTAGATYYSTNSWKDMLDTYQSVTPDISSNKTVYFNIVGDVEGNGSIGGYGYSSTTNTNNGVAIVEGKSLSINGNAHTLHLNTSNDDNNYATGTGGGGPYIRGPFRVPDKGVSEATSLKIKNASIINNITGGIFQSVGTGGSAPTFVYEDVKVTNGAARYAAQPIRNDNGKILFYGTNEFNIQQDHSMTVLGSQGADNQGEWVQGGKWIEVVSGTTTLNQNWGNDQPLYTYNNNSHTLKVADEAHLIWNLNETYTMYYDDGNSGPMVWDIGNDASFEILGTAATASRYSEGWFMWIANDSWTVNVGKRAKLNVSTGGGSINLNEFQGTKVIQWNIGQDATVVLNNLRTSGSLVKGQPGAGSSITLNDPKAFVLNTKGGVVFDPTVNSNNTFPLRIIGNGLRTHASIVPASLVPNQLDVITPNQNNLASNDIWYRQNTGTINGLGATVTSTLTPNNYSAADLNVLKNSKYISWYQPIGYWMNTTKSSMERNFNISLNPNDSNGTPADSSWSNLINGNEPQILVVGDDRGQAPHYVLSVTLIQNNFSDNIDYYWSNPANPADNKNLGTGLAVPITSVTSDTHPFISMENAGANYTLTAPQTSGIKIKAKNTLLTQTRTPSGIFKYTIADGPA